MVGGVTKGRLDFLSSPVRPRHLHCNGSLPMEADRVQPKPGLQMAHDLGIEYCDGT